MRIVIVGTGPAGVTVAETLRQYYDTSEIMMITDKPYPPYSPPAMVAYFETGEEVHWWRGKDFAQRLGLDIPAGEARRQCGAR
jgi:NADPH-dependent 2,4-dienoyl-CoA reductase/sulfur reductase-like enzyme